MKCPICGEDKELTESGFRKSCEKMNNESEDGYIDIMIEGEIEDSL